MAPGLDMHENGDDWEQLRLLAVETRGAACLGESLNLGKRVTDQILNFDTMVIGENCVCTVKRCGSTSWRRARPASPSGASSLSSWSTCDCSSHIMIMASASVTAQLILSLWSSEHFHHSFSCKLVFNFWSTIS